MSYLENYQQELGGFNFELSQRYLRSTTQEPVDGAE